MNLKSLLPFLITPVLVSCGGVQAVNTMTDAVSAATETIAGPKMVSRDLKLGSFSSIESNSVVDVIYTQGKGQGVKATLKGPENIVELITIDVDNNTLRINSRNNNNGGISLNGKKVTLTLTAPVLASVKVNGTGDFDSGRMDCDDLRLEVNGTGDIEIKNLIAKDLRLSVNGTGDIELSALNCNKVRATVNGTGDIECEKVTAKTVDASLSGTGDIELSGSAGRASYTLGGTGDIKAGSLKATTVTAGNSGTGRIRCYAQSSLTAKNTGTGSIVYSGSPNKKEITGKGISRQ